MGQRFISILYIIYKQKDPELISGPLLYLNIVFKFLGAVNYVHRYITWFRSLVNKKIKKII